MKYLFVVVWRVRKLRRLLWKKVCKVLGLNNFSLGAVFFRGFDWITVLENRYRQFSNIFLSCLISWPPEPLPFPFFSSSPALALQCTCHHCCPSSHISHTCADKPLNISHPLSPWLALALELHPRLNNLILVAFRWWGRRRGIRNSSVIERHKTNLATWGISHVEKYIILKCWSAKIQPKSQFQVKLVLIFNTFKADYWDESLLLLLQL